jgi:integrase
MGSKRASGLTKRGGIWHVDKVFRGVRIRESTGTGEVAKAEEHLAKRIEGIRTAQLHGLRPDRTFRMAATKYLMENHHKRTIDDDAGMLEQLDPFIGALTLKQVHMGSLQPFIEKRRNDGVKTRTINLALATVRRILNLASSEWRDEQGMTWLEHAPKITLLKVRDSRPAYPLSREEEDIFFSELPEHLRRMALFKCNSGCREQEVCSLKWDWEVKVPELAASVFIVPGDRVKNEEDRLVVLNRVARSVIESVRGQHREFVFTYTPTPRKAKPGEVQQLPVPHRLTKMNTTAWKSARVRAADKWEKEHGEPAPDGFRRVRVHDLKHTFGRRLRAAGVSFEDRQDLLGHKSGRITTHYSQVELSNLIAAAERACDDDPRKSPPITWLRRKTG